MALPFDDGEESIFTNSEDEDYVDNHPSVGNIDIINNDSSAPKQHSLLYILRSLEVAK